MSARWRGRRAGDRAHAYLARRGAIIGGLLAGSSLSTPFFVAAGLSMIALVLVVLILPESLPAERRSQTKGVRGPQIPSASRPLSIWYARTEARVRGPKVPSKAALK